MSIATFETGLTRTIRGAERPLWLAFGLLSVISGIGLILRPVDLASLYGLPNLDWLSRTLGVRDVGIGLGLLCTFKFSGFMWARAGSEMFDALLIGMAAYHSAHCFGGIWRCTLALLAAALARQLARSATGRRN